MEKSMAKINEINGEINGVRFKYCFLKILTIINHNVAQACCLGTISKG